ncbi:MAG: dihydroneopterin aldolase [Alphaproteobacteria bacterium]
MHKGATDKVLIRDLTLEISAGIYEHEKAQKQRVVFNVEMNVQSNENKALSSIDDVVSYEKIVNEISNISEEKHYELLEELAEKIAQNCLINPQVLSVIVRAEKPDIIKEAACVGVEICRAR